MFTPKNIQVALEELYDLCDPDYMMDMLENYGEEFDDISPTLLAQAFQKRAEMVSEYRMLSTIGEGYNGPIISDHSSKNYREHGKIQQESEKETTP